MIYEIKRALLATEADQENLDSLLNDNWEPFAVTGHYGQFVYHLRRKTWAPEATDEYQD